MRGIYLLPRLSATFRLPAMKNVYAIGLRAATTRMVSGKAVYGLPDVTRTLIISSGHIGLTHGQMESLTHGTLEGYTHGGLESGFP